MASLGPEELGFWAIVLSIIENTSSMRYGNSSTYCSTSASPAYIALGIDNVAARCARKGEDLRPKAGPHCRRPHWINEDHLACRSVEGTRGMSFRMTEPAQR